MSPHAQEAAQPTQEAAQPAQEAAQPAQVAAAVHAEAIHPKGSQLKRQPAPQERASHRGQKLSSVPARGATESLYTLGSRAPGPRPASRPPFQARSSAGSGPPGSSLLPDSGPWPGSAAQARGPWIPVRNSAVGGSLGLQDSIHVSAPRAPRHCPFVQWFGRPVMHCRGPFDPSRPSSAGPHIMMSRARTWPALYSYCPSAEHARLRKT